MLYGPVSDHDDEDPGVLQYPAGRSAPRPRQTKFVLRPIGSITPRLSNAWLVKGLMPKSGLMAVYGPPGSGKSFVILDALLHVAAGLPYAGRKVTQTGVVYIAAEGAEGLDNRIVAAREQLDLDDDVPFALITVAPNLGAGGGDAEILIADIREQAEALGFQPGVTVIDTLARASAGADENSARDMGLLVANVDRIGRELSSLMIVVHHTGKDVERGMRGSSSLHGATDCEWAVAHDETTDERSIRITKMKDGIAGTCAAFRLLPAFLGRDEDGDDVESMTVEIEDAGRPAPKPKATQAAPPAGMKLFLTCLDEALGAVGQDRRPFPDGPIVRCVRREDVRPIFYQRHGGDADAKRQAFLRMVNRATESKLVTAVSADEEVLLWRP